MVKGVTFLTLSWMSQQLRTPAKIGLFALIFILDPFGLTSATDQASNDIFNRINSITSYPDRGQKNITVVLFNDSFLTSQQLHWPLPYQTQAQLFKRILNWQPKAFFVDFLYNNDRSTVDDNIEVLNNTFARFYQMHNTPILVAATTQTDPISAPILSKHIKKVSAQWDGYGSRYPRSVNGQATPAHALYQIYCNNEQQHNTPCEEQMWDRLQPPISVQWGAELAPLQHDLTLNQYCYDPSNKWLSVLHIISSEIFWKLNGTWRQPCPYSRTLLASSLFANDEEARKLFSQIITDQIILVGASVTGARDYVYSPVHGKLPGVYLHAMALDNLISLGQNHTRQAPSLGKQSSLTGSIEVLLLLLFLLWNEATKRAFLTTPAISNLKDSAARVRYLQRKQHFIVLFASRITGFTLVVLTIGLAMFFAFVQHYEPVNWLGLVLLAGAILIRHFRYRRRASRRYIESELSPKEI